MSYYVNRNSIYALLSLIFTVFLLIYFWLPLFFILIIGFVVYIFILFILSLFSKNPNKINIKIIKINPSQDKSRYYRNDSLEDNIIDSTRADKDE